MESVKIKAKMMWPFLDKVNEMSGTYQVDLVDLSDKAIKAIEEMGIVVKHKEGKGSFITCKSQRPIHAYDEGGSRLEGVNIGNESEAVVVLGFYDWTFKGKKGRSPSIKKLVVTKVVEYAGAGAIDEEDDDIL